MCYYSKFKQRLQGITLLYKVSGFLNNESGKLPHPVVLMSSVKLAQATKSSWNPSTTDSFPLRLSKTTVRISAPTNEHTTIKHTQMLKMFGKRRGVHRTAGLYAMLDATVLSRDSAGESSPDLNRNKYCIF